MTRTILRTWAPAIAASIRATFPAIIRTTGLPVAITAARDVLVVTLARLLGLPRLTRAALNRQIILGLAQLLTLGLAHLILLLLNLALLLALLLIDLLLLLTFDIAQLDILLLDLLLLLAVGLPHLILLTLEYALLFALLLIDLLLLLAYGAALLIELLLNIAALPVATGVAAQPLITRQGLGADAHAQKAQSRQLPDASFHAFLTRAGIHVFKTAMA